MASPEELRVAAARPQVQDGGTAAASAESTSVAADDNEPELADLEWGEGQSFPALPELAAPDHGTFEEGTASMAVPTAVALTSLMIGAHFANDWNSRSFGQQGRARSASSGRRHGAPGGSAYAHALGSNDAGFHCNLT